VFFFSARYHHAFHGARTVPHKAILVPTAERDPAVAVSIFAPLFRGVRGIMYNSFEERAMINALADNHAVPGVVVGIGSDVPAHTDPHRARRKFKLDGRYVIYVGRIDENKGCKELFAFFERYAAGMRRDLSLVLVGHSILPIPDNPARAAPRLPRRPRQVRPGRRRGSADHAFVLREPVDGGRSRPGRWAGPCSPTASATCSAGSA